MTERVRTTSAPAAEPLSGTRDSILRSALTLFSRLDYDQVELGEVAEAAGLVQDLTAAHFGTKEELFAAVLEAALAGMMPPLSGGALLGRGAVGIMASGMAERESDHLPMLILRGATNARAARILCDGIERHFERPLAAVLAGSHGDQRAALLFAVLAGFQVARKILEAGESKQADPAILSRHLVPLLQMLIDPPEPTEACATG